MRPEAPLRIMLDSNIFDRLMDADVEVDVTGALRRAVEAGAVTLLVTHIQVDEILDVSEDEDRRNLIHTLMRAGIREIPTMGLYLDKSRLGHARLADEETYERINAYVGDNRAELDDALIAATAAFEGAVLVTEDRGFRARYQRHFPGLDVWDADRLLTSVGRLPNKRKRGRGRLHRLDPRGSTAVNVADAPEDRPGRQPLTVRGNGHVLAGEARALLITAAWRMARATTIPRPVIPGRPSRGNSRSRRALKRDCVRRLTTESRPIADRGACVTAWL
jgi:predicted nucleic acid-binding protein